MPDLQLQLAVLIEIGGPQAMVPFGAERDWGDYIACPAGCHLRANRRDGPGTDEWRAHLLRFYSLLDMLEVNIGGARVLSMCSDHMQWPERGVYFFREDGENRSHAGLEPRIVRVGTHALKIGGSAKLWTRLSQHKGLQRRSAPITASGGCPGPVLCGCWLHFSSWANFEHDIRGRGGRGGSWQGTENLVPAHVGHSGGCMPTRLTSSRTTYIPILQTISCCR